MSTSKDSLRRGGFCKGAFGGGEGGEKFVVARPGWNLEMYIAMYTATSSEPRFLCNAVPEVNHFTAISPRGPASY